MSMNLTLTIDGKDIDLIQTTTKETNFVLGVDVDNQVEKDGFTRKDFRISSIHNPDEFYEALERFESYAAKRSAKMDTVRNLATEAVYLIYKTIDENSFNESNFSFVDDSDELEPLVEEKEIIFSFI